MKQSWRIQGKKGQHGATADDFNSWLWSGPSWGFRQLALAPADNFRQLALAPAEDKKTADSGSSWRSQQLNPAPADDINSWLWSGPSWWYQQLTPAPADDFNSWLWLQLMISTAESGSSCRFPQLNLKFCQRIMAGVSSADSVSSWKFRQLIASTGTEVLDGA